MKPRIGDFVILLVFIALAFAIISIPLGNQSGEFARVRVNGVSEKLLDLRSGAGEYVINGVKVVVENGKVRVKESSCPDSVCVNTGEISKPGQAIVCLPNRVSIQIEGNAKVDTVAGG